MNFTAVQYCLKYAAIFLLCSTALGDKITFKNGDSLTGRYLRTEDGYIYFQTEVIGEIKVSNLDAEITRDTEGATEEISPPAMPVTEETPTVPPISQSAEKLVEPPLDFMQPAASVQPAAEESLPWWIDNDFTRFLARYQLLEHWKSRLSAGYIWQSGESSRKDVLLRFQTERKLDKQSQLQFDARWDYSWQTSETLPDVITRDLYLVNGRYRHDWDERYFGQIGTRYLKDMLKGIDHDTEVNAGAGWVFLRTDRMRASIAPALSAKYLSVEGRTDGWRLMTTLFQDFTYRVGKQVNFVEEARYSVEPGDTENWTLDILMRLEAKVDSGLGVALQWDYNYNSLVAASIRKGQQRASTSLFYEF